MSIRRIDIAGTSIGITAMVYGWWPWLFHTECHLFDCFIVLGNAMNHACVSGAVGVVLLAYWLVMKYRGRGSSIFMLLGGLASCSAIMVVMIGTLIR